MIKAPNAERMKVQFPPGQDVFFSSFRVCMKASVNTGGIMYVRNVRMSSSSLSPSPSKDISIHSTPKNRIKELLSKYTP